VIKSNQQQMELRLPRIATVRKGAPKPEKGPGRDLAYFRLDRARWRRHRTGAKSNAGRGD
jgi:hypothetical protein